LKSWAKAQKTNRNSAAINVSFFMML